MRIAMIHWGYPPIIGGVETHLSLLCPALTRLGHRVHLLTGSHPNARNAYVDKGAHIRRTPSVDLNWLYRRGFGNLSGEVRREIGQFLDRSRAQLVHAHNLHYFSPIHARILRKEADTRKIPVILTAHNVWHDTQFITLTVSIPWDYFIAVSNYVKRSLEGYGVDPKKITTIHHGIDGKPYFNADPNIAKKKYPLLEGRKIIFHPARMGLAKGNHFSVLAFRLVKAVFPEALLVMAGTKNIIDWGGYQPREIAYIMQLLEMFELTDDILIDQYSLDFIPYMYASSDVCIYPSISEEPFGLVMLEAMASGKPIIVSRSGGMPEIIKSGVNGFVISPSDYRPLAKTIIRLLKNPELARQIGSKGKEIFQQKYYLERMVDQILSVYQKVLEKR